MTIRRKQLNYKKGGVAQINRRECYKTQTELLVQDQGYEPQSNKKLSIVLRKTYTIKLEETAIVEGYTAD